eukprot:g45689.t1
MGLKVLMLFISPQMLPDQQLLFLLHSHSVLEFYEGFGDAASEKKDGDEGPVSTGGGTGDLRQMALGKERRRTHPIYINVAEVERMQSLKFLGVMITDNLSSTSHVDAMVKKAQQRLFFLRLLRKVGMSTRSLTNFYRCTTESIMAWYSNCSAQDHKKLQEVMCTAQTIMKANLPSMNSIHTMACHVFVFSGSWNLESIGKIMVYYCEVNFK